MPLDAFHPAVSAWFAERFEQPTACQRQAWPAIAAGRAALICAPTGSGKTLAAFLAAIDSLVRRSVEGELPDETRVLYVSPLKALSNDIHRNLEEPLAGIDRQLQGMGSPRHGIRALVRTGDTPQAARALMRRRPPHILVTTPESLYILLTSESGRRMLATTRSVIVDEIHAVAGSKRGAHLALSLERLEGLCARPPQRIGLSATVHPVARIARLLTGERDRPCEIIDQGRRRDLDLGLELPGPPRSAVLSGEGWEAVHERIAALAREHRTTLVFVNTRRLAERLARHLSERLGEERVAAHHGSLSREQRLAAEQRLKAGELRVMVATASLELGIDIGEVELVVQVGVPRSIAALLQRAGRAAHRVGGKPKARIFPLTRDELVEAAALLAAVRRGELDETRVPEAPLDVLAQQIVAEVAAGGERGEEELYHAFRRAWPYRELPRERFDAVVRMLAEGYAGRRGRQGARLHRDAVNGRLRPRRGALLTAVTCGGAIPDTAEYEVRLEPENRYIGSVDEDFAIESLAGDIFQLGNASWRILRVEADAVRVEDARGQPPSIPFWFGEAPARSDAFSAALSRLREELDGRLDDPRAARRWLQREIGLGEEAAAQICDYLAAGRAALEALPSHRTLVLERFFDESGGMQLVLHSPFGARVNRAWGLALRKRFCRSFNFELQAAAGEEAIVLSLGETHSFALEEVWRYLNSASVRGLLIQALLDAPMFTIRWRWNATCSLAVPRFSGGRRVPPRLLRMRAEDLVSVVFPEQLACLENIRGDREIPDHPLVQQTLADCLYEAMDIEGLERVLRGIERGEIRLFSHDLTGPSPLAQEILNARPYAFLDPAPLEERRTRAVIGRRWLDPEEAADLGRLDAGAVRRVQEEAWPEARDAEELHDALCLLGFVREQEGRARGWEPLLEELVSTGRAARARPAGGEPLWVAAERAGELLRALGAVDLHPPLRIPEGYRADALEPGQALIGLLRARLSGLGPVTAEALGSPLGLPREGIGAALAGLENEGFALRGRFTGTAEEEWCERRLLARINRYTVERLRAEIAPVSRAAYMRFLFDWQHLSPASRLRGSSGLEAVLEQLRELPLPAVAWEGEVLPARLEDYDPAWLDQLCLSGRWFWRRAPLSTPLPARAGPLRSAPILLLPRAGTPVTGEDAAGGETLGANARRLLQTLRRQGASFFVDLVTGSGLLRTQVEEALAELAACGLVTCDSFDGLRTLITPASRRRGFGRGRRARRGPSLDGAGRWSLAGVPPSPAADEPGSITRLVELLLRRWGVFSHAILRREGIELPWRLLLGELRRQEARGEIRGGRFIEGLSGEQYALPEAVGALRKKREAEDSWLVLPATDPANLTGGLLPGERVPAVPGNRILFHQGTPVAALVAGSFHRLGSPHALDENELRRRLEPRAPLVRLRR